MSGPWWHVYGGEVPDMAFDADGNSSPAWGLTIYGGSTVHPNGAESVKPEAPCGLDGFMVPYLASFDHDPTDEERDALAPDGYRDVES